MSRVFFTDYNLGKRFPEILAASGIRVERHIDHFRQDCPDEVWLEAIGRRGWIAITCDQRIRYKPNERAAVMAHQVALLICIGQATFSEHARSFVATRARIERFVDAHQRPYIAKVYRGPVTDDPCAPLLPGRIEQWYPPAS